MPYAIELLASPLLRKKRQPHYHAAKSCRNATPAFEAAGYFRLPPTIPALAAAGRGGLLEGRLTRTRSYADILWPPMLMLLDSDDARRRQASHCLMHARFMRSDAHLLTFGHQGMPIIYYHRMMRYFAAHLFRREGHFETNFRKDTITPLGRQPAVAAIS